jgi:hypothetical protein
MPAADTTPRIPSKYTPLVSRPAPSLVRLQQMYQNLLEAHHNEPRYADDLDLLRGQILRFERMSTR